MLMIVIMCINDGQWNYYNNINYNLQVTIFFETRVKRKQRQRDYAVFEIVK